MPTPKRLPTQRLADVLEEYRKVREQFDQLTQVMELWTRGEAGGAAIADLQAAIRQYLHFYPILPPIVYEREAEALLRDAARQARARKYYHSQRELAPKPQRVLNMYELGEQRYNAARQQQHRPVSYYVDKANAERTAKAQEAPSAQAAQATTGGLYCPICAQPTPCASGHTEPGVSREHFTKPPETGGVF